jgi:hypothetical protein
MMSPNRLSHAVVRGGSRRIPRPRLGENTLQLADELVVTQSPDGTWFVAVRWALIWGSVLLGDKDGCVCWGGGLRTPCSWLTSWWSHSWGRQLGEAGSRASNACDFF